MLSVIITIMWRAKLSYLLPRKYELFPQYSEARSTKEAVKPPRQTLKFTGVIPDGQDLQLTRCHEAHVCTTSRLPLKCL
jgi:hypothetical protein